MPYYFILRDVNTDEIVADMTCDTPEDAQGFASDGLELIQVDSDWVDYAGSLYNNGNPDKSRGAIDAKRKRLLAASDWMASPDRTMTEAQRAYRQALRDIPEQEGYPNNVVWPTEP